MAYSFKQVIISNSQFLSKKSNILQSSLITQFTGSSQQFLSVLLSLLNDQEFLKLSDIDILFKIHVIVLFGFVTL